MGDEDRPPLRLAHDRDVRGDGARRAAHAIRDWGEPGAIRSRSDQGAQTAHRSRLPDRPGHLPDKDGRDGRRGAARVGVVGRVQRHRHELRAARADRAQGAGSPRRRARRQLDHHRARATARLRVGGAGGRADLGRAALAEPDAHRHELRAARGQQGSPMAVRHARRSRLAVPPWPAVEGPDRGAAGAVHRHAARAAGGRAHRRVPDPADHGASARVLQHRRAVEPLPLAAAPWREPRPVSRGRGRTRAHRR